VPQAPTEATATEKPEKPARKSKYIPWAELLHRTFGFEIVCAKCQSPPIPRDVDLPFQPLRQPPGDCTRFTNRPAFARQDHANGPAVPARVEPSAAAPAHYGARDNETTFRTFRPWLSRLLHL
jgi:hypothetical protein